MKLADITKAVVQKLPGREQLRALCGALGISEAQALLDFGDTPDLVVDNVASKLLLEVTRFLSTNPGPADDEIHVTALASGLLLDLVKSGASAQCSSSLPHVKPAELAQVAFVCDCCICDWLRLRNLL